MSVISEEKLIEDSFVSDEALVSRIQNGDSESTEFLIYKYRHFVRAKASKYFLCGADREDIIQEGMIGLYKAIRDFKEDKLSSFRAFAELCITRQIISAVKTSTRQKHIPLNSYISLDKPIFEDESTQTLLDIIIGTDITDPAALFITQEKNADFEQRIAEKLSDLERQVLSLYMAGHTYIEISEELNKHTKSIDNALQRIKRKLERHLEINELYA
ncbi:RNA polymerase sporulation sigma factor SigH [Neobacillus sp. PS3-34]|uniref:RNA polymerase sporulation sigma factor SigH n=1 Tax=Neobacillus sp. PS3-34 TaxID=3070678 RepID=UPI0027DFCD19|nr:RNA polymerase sporulation sigma factor SigH [Neobacillus sp. PS3-34]WML48825.1 RNA polymerase sporulation sigma factor SigH [Neobacillus sp. PS3-34]